MMGLLSHKVKRSEIAAGDHIYTYRAAFTYSHHGIYVGGDEVVHFTPEQSEGSVGNSCLGFSSPVSGSSLSLSASNLNASSICSKIPDCGSRQPQSGVVLSCLDCFLGNGSLYRFEYGVATSVFLMKLRGGTCTTAKSDPPEEVIHRAMYLLQNGFGNYDVFKNNCEDFALFCKTGLIVVGKSAPGRSGQVAGVNGLPVEVLLSSILKFFVPSPIGVVTEAIAYYYMNRYAADIGVRNDVFKLKMESMALFRGSSVGVSKEEAQGVFDGDLSLKKAVNEEARHLAWKNDESYHIASEKASNEAVGKDGLNEAVSEGVVLLEACSNDLQDRALRQLLDEAVEDHASKKTEESEGGTGREVDESKSGLHSSVFEEKGLSEKGSNCQEDTRDYNQNETDEAEDKDGADNENDNRSENENENEEEVENENENEGEHAGAEHGPVPVSLNGKYRSQHYPLRPDAMDCQYYMRTGMCKFGSNCKFNHPPRRLNQASTDKFKQKEDNLERRGPTECKYYLTSVECKYRKACRYNHHGGKASVASVLEYNFLGLPIRPGEKECPYYMRNGSCKYGSNCRFDHPDPTAVGTRTTDHPSGYGNEGSISTMNSWSSSRTLNKTAPYVPAMFPPTQGMPSPTPEWNRYQASVYPTSERSLPVPPAFAMNNIAADPNFYAHHQPLMLVEEFPERPGQPECDYFMKTGDCKFRSACKFRHPKSRVLKTASCVLSDRGLPLRPDQRVCTHYNRYGICKFGPACKFDHPVNYGNSVSSPGSGRE